MIGDIIGNLIDSRLEINFEDRTFVISRVSNYDYIIKNGVRYLLIQGDSSPDPNGYIRKREVLIEENDMGFHCRVHCEYASLNFSSSSILGFKLSKQTDHPVIYNRYN